MCFVVDFSGVNFWLRDFFVFWWKPLGFFFWSWFLPPFDHPRHLKSWVPPPSPPGTHSSNCILFCLHRMVAVKSEMPSCWSLKSSHDSFWWIVFFHSISWAGRRCSVEFMQACSCSFFKIFICRHQPLWKNSDSLRISVPAFMELFWGKCQMQTWCRGTRAAVYLCDCIIIGPRISGKPWYLDIFPPNNPIIARGAHLAQTATLFLRFNNDLWYFF